MFIYLAGAMSYYDCIHQFELATRWRDEAVNKLKVCGYNDRDIFNPCKNYNINKTFDSRGVVYQNIFYLSKASLIILNMKDLDKSPGTLFEICYAILYHIPVIAFGESKLYEQPHVHESITIKFATMDEVLKYIKNMYTVK
ncbi:hypothetical protein ACFHWD_03210 [Clostridium sp. MT-14]|uniref:hypothetical protein n=1 Tax=Clostridium sp. MT-14 TaxID=3348360 RepID=UPI0035F2584E